jgi:methylamine dehydrogenase accessory protein MauD
MDLIALLARLLLAGVFLAAALGKLADHRGSRQALVDFGVPNWLIAPLVLLLPLAELATAGLLIPDATTRLGALAALALLGLFIGAIVASLAQGRKPDCHCFGQLHSAPVGWSTVLRNGILAALAAMVLWWGGSSPDFTSVAAASTVTWIALGIAAVALALAAIEGWFLLNLLPQQGRILVRLERVETELGRAPGSGIPIGEQAPEFELPSLTGDKLTLTALRSAGQPVLLFFSNPHCAPCDALLPEVVQWQREQAHRVTVAVITDGPLDANRGKADKHGVRLVLLQKDREVKEAYDVTGTPSAVLVACDGSIASRNAYGEEHVRQLLQQTLSGEPERRQVSGQPALAVGQLTPPLLLPDLEGNTVDLAGFRGTSTLFLFWSPSCGFCQEMLPALKKWERKRPAGCPKLLVVSSGTVEANRAMALTSPVVLDPDGSAMRAFGANGTPMAVLIHADGRIASDLTVGAQAILALASTTQNGAVGKLRRI